MLILPEWGFMIMIQMVHLKESHLISSHIINTSGTALFKVVFGSYNFKWLQTKQCNRVYVLNGG